MIFKYPKFYGQDESNYMVYINLKDMSISSYEFESTFPEQLLNISVSNHIEIKKGKLSEFKDTYNNLLLKLKDEKSEFYNLYRNIFNLENLNNPLAQTCVDIMFLSALAPYLDSKTININQSLDYLKKINYLYPFATINLIRINLNASSKYDYLKFLSDLYAVQTDSSFYCLISNINYSIEDLMDLAGNNILVLSLAFSSINDFYPNSHIESIKLCSNSKDKISTYLSRIRSLDLNDDNSLNLYVQHNQFDPETFSSLIKENEWFNVDSSLKDENRINTFIKDSIKKELLVEHENKYYFSLKGRILATYIDSRMFSKLMK